MALHFTWKLGKVAFETVVNKASDALKLEGFTSISNVNLGDILVKEPDHSGQKLCILLACNPGLAYKAISLESHSGLMLPSQVTIREVENGHIEISAFNPMECMDSNMATSSLEEVSVEVSHHLRRAIDRLQIHRVKPG